MFAYSTIDFLTSSICLQAAILEDMTLCVRGSRSSRSTLPQYEKPRTGAFPPTAMAHLAIVGKA